MNLDDVLAAWAAGVRLDETEATAIYERIVQTPRLTTVRSETARSKTVRPGRELAPGIDAAWWRSFTADYATWVVASNRPVRWAA